MKTKCSCFGGLLVLSVLFGGAARSAADTQSTSYSTSIPIPDFDANGISDTRQVNFPGAISIDSIQVSLSITGGWNGDYYAFLRHGGSGFAVLLNRPGVSGTNPYGYGDSGFNITLSDTAPNGDVHFYQTVLNPGGSSLTGLWQTDGRNVDPDLVTGASPRNAMLSSFAGMDPNGAWSLYVADDSPGGTGTLTGWGLSITAEMVPEPGVVSLLVVGSGLGFAVLRRQQRSR